MMEEKFDVIVVGAGLAGLTAGYVLGKAGLNTVILERGEYPGSKNVCGGILFTTILGELLPDFINSAPIERHVIKRKFSVLSKDTEMAFSFRTERFNEPPYNNTFTVLRAKFDRWFAQKVEETGTMILPKVIVDELIWEKTRCIGVKSRLTDGDIYADAVIIAEGANSVLAEREGLKDIPSQKRMALAVKEVLSLPEEVIQDRFELKNTEGVAIEYFGDAVNGMFGSAFIYTNKESISVGVGCSLDEIGKKKINSHDLLEYFKNHKCVQDYLRGGTPVEYCAHMIPEAGYKGIPNVSGNGVLLVGDCAGLVNTSFFHEGTNLSMASGMMAAETVIEAKQENDFSLRILSRYRDRIKNSFIIEDLIKFKEFPFLGDKRPALLNDYPEIIAELITEYFTVDGKSKKEVEKNIIKKFRKKIGIPKIIKDSYAISKSMGWI